ncbi:MAG: hypothetical protein WC955_06755 [Elusimicrobiota bacterium]
MDILNLLISSPPVVFIVLLAVIVAVSFLLNGMAFKKGENETTSYSCGEDFDGHMPQPDYRQFFPFAFFFTILHVVVLVIATVPAVNVSNLAMAVVYIIGAGAGLLVLLRG